MKKIQLTQGYVALVDDEDYKRVNKFKWCAQVRRNRDGTVKKVYAVRGLLLVTGKQMQVLMHRFILSVTDPEVEVDHEDHNGLNNQRYNLRKATHAENRHNQRISRINTSGYKGVSWVTFRSGNGKWKAELSAYGKRKYLGLFTSKEEAARAYDAAAVKYHEVFACTNANLAVRHRLNTRDSRKRNQYAA